MQRAAVFSTVVQLSSKGWKDIWLAYKPGRLIVELAQVWRTAFTAKILQNQLLSWKAAGIQTWWSTCQTYGLKKQDSQQQFFKSSCFLNNSWKSDLVVDMLHSMAWRSRIHSNSSSKATAFLNNSWKSELLVDMSQSIAPATWKLINIDISR